MILDVITYPNQILRQKSDPVLEMTEELGTFLDDLIETMLERDGVGLAAVQVGRPLQIFVLNDNGPKVFINPAFGIVNSGVVNGIEGCLSFPGVFAKIDRYVKVELTALDRNLEVFCYQPDGLMSRAVQHEIDHCQGMLMIDHLSHLKRQMVLKKYNKRMGIK